MPGSTYSEWFADVWKAYAKHVEERGVEDSQHVCKFIPYHLAEVRPDIYNELRDTDWDCFHDGDFELYLAQVAKLWDRPKAFSIEVHRGLIIKLLSQVEYTPGGRHNEHPWAAGRAGEVAGYDTHNQHFLSDAEEDLLRQIKGYPR